MGVSLEEVPYEPGTEDTDRWTFALSDELNGEHGGTLFEHGVARRPVTVRVLRKFIVSHGRSMLGAKRVEGAPREIGDCRRIAAAETAADAASRTADKTPLDARVQHGGVTQALPEIDGKSPHGEAPGPQPIISHQAEQLEGARSSELLPPPAHEPERGGEALEPDPGQEAKPEQEQDVLTKESLYAATDHRPEPDHTQQEGGPVVEYERGPDAVDGAPLEPDPQPLAQQPQHTESPVPARSSWRSPKGHKK